MAYNNDLRSFENKVVRSWLMFGCSESEHLVLDGGYKFTVRREPTVVILYKTAVQSLSGTLSSVGVVLYRPFS